MSLTAFFKENVVNPFEEIEFVVSDRFKDEDGKPIAWKLRPMSPNNSLKRGDSAFSFDKNGNSDFKMSVFYMNNVLGCVVYPNLNDRQLQDSYGVMGAEELLNAMLNASEFNKLSEKCRVINGLDRSFDDMKGEVKN